MPKGEDLVLEESHRQKLDGIVQKMSDNGESGDNIQFVVNDFKNKYGVKKRANKGKPRTFYQRFRDSLSAFTKEWRK